MSVDLMQQAKEFRQVYNLMDGFTSRAIQKKLIDEEWNEFHEAFYYMKEEDQLKELGDLVYVCFQYAASQHWDLNETIRRIHESNLSKLDDNDKPIYRADGKVMKGPNYKPPLLKDLC